MSDFAYKFVQSFQKAGKLNFVWDFLLVVGCVVMCWLPLYLSAALPSWKTGSERGLILGIIMLISGSIVPYVLRLQSRIASLEKQLAEVTNSNLGKQP